jgi:protein O-mannosyl-transferase
MPHNPTSFLNVWPIQIFLLAIVVVLTYGHTLDVPFYLDDFSSIQENPVIYQWQGTLIELWQFAALRIIGYFSFALDYQIHQFQVAGYHLVNIVIHFLTGCTVLGLLRGLVRTPLLNDTLSEKTKHRLPLVVALLFILHPLQIQAVTYIVQRLASLAALFYIGSMACFIQARLATSPDFLNLRGLENLNMERIFWTFACLFLALLGFFTKQNTVTLPIALLLLELTFFPLHLRRLLLTGAITILGLVILWMIMALVFQQNPFSLQTMQALTQETTEISRTSYLATQMSVIWTYLYLFIWPVSSHIDYDYPITEGFLYVNDQYHLIARLLHSEALWAAAGHLILISIAIYHFRRRPLLAFGLLFYYLAHTVESSLIPIRDVIFEHRTYLPNLGLCLLFGWLLIDRLPHWLTKVTTSSLVQPLTLTVLTLLLLGLGTATWHRNQLWRDSIALWQHNVTQSPGKQRGWIILGKHLLQANRPQEGLDALNHAITKHTNPDGSQSISLTPETALNIVVAHKMLRHYDEALKWIDIAFQDATLRPFDQAKFLVNKGNILFEQRRYTQAEAAYRQAITLYPQNLKARINLASVLGATGRVSEAKALYQEVLTIDPSNTFVMEQLQKLPR